VLRRFLVLLASLALFSAPSVAQLLSRNTDIDFFRDVSSRQLKGLATRSDGRLVAGPTLGAISALIPADLLWCLEPTADPARWLIGTGPTGGIVELTLNPNATSGTARELVRLDDPQVFALQHLADGSILAGTSPRGALYLIRDNQAVARALLPVDSIFDLLTVDAGTALAATGNPGRLYRIDLARFAASGIATEKATRPTELADHGITLLGEIRDRNIRRIALLADGRIAAGSAPKGNVYIFPCLAATPPAPDAAKSPDDTGPVILQENRDAEVTDLLPQPNGDLYATIVYSASSGESRITPSAVAPKDAADGKSPAPPPAQVERFGGRSALVWFPAHGFPEILTARSGVSFYGMVRHGDTMIIAGGEQGELLGYDLNARLSLTFAGSDSAQLNSIAPLPGSAGKFLVLHNNAPGIALLDFSAGGPRQAETRRIDLGTPAQLGALRFNRLRHVSERDLALEIRTNNSSDEVEGWGPWTPLQMTSDGGWHAADLRGRHVKLRLRLPATGGTPRPAETSALEIDRASLFMLPQNRRPQMQDFRLLTPGFGVIPASEPPPPASISLSQMMQPPKEDERRRGSFLSSQVVPSPGTQVVLWTVTDPDGDNLLFTFSIRREDEAAWTDIVASTTQNYAQFSTSHLPDGVYFTRLVAVESAPRSPADRLTHVVETDDLIVDHTPPEIVSATARGSDGVLAVTIHGRDRLSLLESIELVFNNGVRETVQQPVDGVRDGREETFRLEVPLARVSNATAVEVTLFDAAGNGSSRRLTW